MKRHINIPVFIPHLGCKNACIFCNQRRISGKAAFDRTAIEAELERATQTIDYDRCEVEIAFFGGSFTGIDRADMLYLLGLADRYIARGLAQSVRISTRPDYIDDEILAILAAHGVTDIELGLQSLCDRVLLASKRGHTADCARAACRLIKARGFTLVGQMMIGLPESALEDEVATAREIAALCDAVRIYPTVVFRDTELCDRTLRNTSLTDPHASPRYTPLSMDDAVRRSEEVLHVFIGEKIPVIRLGLCAADTLFEPGTIVGGAYHSAFGELVYAAFYRRVLRDYIAANFLADKLRGADITIEVPRGETSKVSGQKRQNKSMLQNEYYVNNVRIIEKPELFWYNIRIVIDRCRQEE